MEVLTAKDGSFAFIFSSEEKELGLEILNHFKPTNADGEKEIADAKSRIITAGSNTSMQ